MAGGGRAPRHRRADSGTHQARGAKDAPAIKSSPMLNMLAKWLRRRREARWGMAKRSDRGSLEPMRNPIVGRSRAAAALILLATVPTSGAHAGPADTTARAIVALIGRDFRRE